MVAVVSQNDAPVAVDGDAFRMGELAVAAALAADGCGRAIRRRNSALARDQMTRAVQRNTPRRAELAVACALLAHGPQVLPVAVP
jgi:hypothetical protein